MHSAMTLASAKQSGIAVGVLHVLFGSVSRQAHRARLPVMRPDAPVELQLSRSSDHLRHVLRRHLLRG